MRHRFVRTAPLCIALVLSAGAHANLLDNSSFESGTFNPPNRATQTLPVGSTAIDGWTTTGDLVAWIGTGNPWSLTANDGERFLDLTDYAFGAPFGGVTQTIPTIVRTAYTLSFDLGSSDRWGRPSAIRASAGGTTAIFTSLAADGISDINDWDSFSMQFVAVAPTTNISLVGTVGQNYIGLDNVSVAVVPEPTVVAMMLAGLGTLFGVARRRGGA